MIMEADYIEQNRRVYDNLAEEFEEKLDIRTENNKHIIENFSRELEKRCDLQNCEILELGPGAGYLCKILSEKGVKMTAIEFSEKMANVCKKTAPLTHVIVDEFLAHDFKDQQYDGVLEIAFLHLFPSRDTPKVLEKIKKLLKPKGVLYTGTTVHQNSSEGLFPKINFKKPFLRFRRRFTKNEFEKTLINGGFKILQSKSYIDHEEEGKVWIDYIVEANRN